MSGIVIINIIVAIETKLVKMPDAIMFLIIALIIVLVIWFSVFSLYKPKQVVIAKNMSVTAEQVNMTTMYHFKFITNTVIWISNIASVTTYNEKPKVVAISKAIINKSAFFFTMIIILQA